MVDSWTDSMTPRERVETIATTLSTPRTVNWVAEQAEVTRDTAKKHLDDLADSGVLLVTDNDTYVPDPTRAYFDHLRELILTNDKAELRDELESIATRIEGWKTTYGVTDPAELEATLADDRSATEVRERRQVLRRWENSLRSRETIRTALRLYDEIQSLRTTFRARFGSMDAGDRPWDRRSGSANRSSRSSSAASTVGSLIRGCVTVRYDPSRRDPNEVVAEIDPTAVLGRPYSSPEARLRVEFDTTGDRPRSRFQWWEPDVGRGVGWHADETEPEYGPVHLRIEHPDGTTPRQSADHAGDEHPYRTFERRLTGIPGVLSRLEWE
jgi:hypothetical protein